MGNDKLFQIKSLIGNLLESNSKGNKITTILHPNTQTIRVNLIMSATYFRAANKSMQ
jgi:hypothetical protein